MNNTHIAMAASAERPWWSIRIAFLATLAVLVAILVTLLSKPEVLRYAGL